MLSYFRSQGRDGSFIRKNFSVCLIILNHSSHHSIRTLVGRFGRMIIMGSLCYTLHLMTGPHITMRTVSKSSLVHTLTWCTFRGSDSMVRTFNIHLDSLRNRDPYPSQVKCFDVLPLELWTFTGSSAHHHLAKAFLGAPWPNGSSVCFHSHS